MGSVRIREGTVGPEVSTIRGIGLVMWFNDALPAPLRTQVGRSLRSAAIAMAVFGATTARVGSSQAQARPLIVETFEDGDAPAGWSALLPSTTWLQSAKNADIAYFLMSHPPVIHRYDMNGGTWLPDLALSAPPTAFAVDADGIYVAYGTHTVRRNLDGSGETTLRNTTAAITEVVTAGDFAFLLGDFDTLWSADKRTTEVIDQETFFYSMRGLSAGPLQRRILGTSGTYLLRVRYDESGRFIDQRESRNLIEYPTGAQTWLLPGEARVVDSSGNVYFTNDLQHAASFGDQFDDLDFYVDVPVILRDRILTAYTNTFHEAGRYELAASARKIYVAGDTVYAFRDRDHGGIDVEAVPIAALSPPVPGQPVDPHGLAFDPDRIEIGLDGTVYLFSRAHLSIFPWSLTTRNYRDTITLDQAAKFIAYAAERNALLLEYPTGEVSQMVLGTPIVEQPLFSLTEDPCAIAAVGTFVLGCYLANYDISHEVYSPDGQVISTGAHRSYATDMAWDGANRRVFYFDDDYPSYLQWEDIAADGAIGPQQYRNLPRTEPHLMLRVAPDGSLVVTNLGDVFDSRQLEFTDALPTTFADAAWVHGTLVTLRAAGVNSRVEAWASGLALPSSVLQAPGTPIRLLGYGGQLIVITSVDGVPELSVYDDPLNVPPLCAGDCDRDGRSSTTDLVLAVRIALGMSKPSRCLAVDLNQDGIVSIDELVAAVDRSLVGCLDAADTAELP